jgi:hemoglobin-like flavoprotein
VSVASQGARGQESGPARIAQQSYERCLMAPDFFAYLYEQLLASDPRIPPMFAKTEFPKQHRLLQHGIGLLLIYARRADDELLERLAARHSQRGMNIEPGMYRHFVTSLLAAVRRADPQCNDEVEEAWRQAVRPGLDFMSARHGR